ncbi:hypothetical protein L596_000464 [Steinernema carpocapsae]|uniref:Uncharacterized protein n=1 Tax=Steinernema carpocapsae TaxID=34508 RepID=A0A4U8UI51_STECR|nr:hypothetical protein L596_000464 [Steinernema carpocapsae]
MICVGVLCRQPSTTTSEGSTTLSSSIPYIQPRPTVFVSSSILCCWRGGPLRRVRTGSEPNSSPPPQRRRHRRFNVGTAVPWRQRRTEQRETRCQRLRPSGPTRNSALDRLFFIFHSITWQVNIFVFRFIAF